MKKLKATQGVETIVKMIDDVKVKNIDAFKRVKQNIDDINGDLNHVKYIQESHEKTICSLLNMVNENYEDVNRLEKQIKICLILIGFLGLSLITIGVFF